MHAGSPGLPSPSLSPRELDRGAHNRILTLWQRPMRTPVIVGFSSLNSVGYQSPGE